MKKKIFFTYLLNILWLFNYAQFNGGNGDGYSKLIKAETTLNNTDVSLLYFGNNGDGYSDDLLANITLNNTNISQLYVGGNGDGYAQDLFAQTTLLNLDLSSLYTGSNGDGYAQNLFAQTTLLNLDLTSLYTGNNGDGYAQNLFAQTTLLNLDLTSLYTGNNGDGYAQNLFAQTTLLNLDLTSLYTGNNGDGYAQNLFAQTTLLNLDLASLYTGNNGDGYAQNLFAQTTLLNLDLAILFNGGNGDGYSRGEYFQNPLCNRMITAWNGAVWSNGVPNNTTQVAINNFYDTSINGNLTACSCVVRTNGFLTVNTNQYAHVVNDFINNGDVNILHQGSFVQDNNDATVTGSGVFTTLLETTLLLDEDRFTFFSSPVQNQDLNVFNIFADNRRWRFNEATQDWYLINVNDTMIPAVGYPIKAAPDTGQYPQIGFADFDGAFNNGIYSYPLTYNAGGIDDDNSLVGNPYPSAINATLLLNNNANANAFYFWTHNSTLLADGSDYSGDDYAVWNSSGGIASGSGSAAPSGFIASGQGFFVDAVGPGNLVFNNSLRVTNQNTDFRRPEKDLRNRIWLNLTNENGLFSQILINSSNEGTTAFDPKYDAVRFNAGNPISFYSQGENDALYAIQALPILSENDVVPLAFDVINENVQNLKISIDNIENFNNVSIYLKDNLLNIIHDLELADYDFSVSETGSFTNRFELVFNRNALNTDENSLQKEKLIVTNQTEREILVKTQNSSIITRLKAYDVLGKIIIDIKPNQSKIIIPTNINQGTVLFIKAQLENGNILNTKFIKI